MSNDSKPVLTRRRVFAGAGAVGALAAAAAAVPLIQPTAQTPPVDTAALPDADGRYTATQHVLRYYQTARV